MKKLIFSLVATVMITSFGFANPNEPVKEKKDEKASKEKVKREEEVKKVSCSITIGDYTYSSTYSCFFCWGGSDDGCKAALLDFIELCQNY
ncbi:hypothetical protein [Flavobacterium piscis]|uniref:Uncharacterized protein n=1 Tax=Flavobacterium piscis TaxID=1114874 RepID=A0ABU1Y286_9FLAO|nr:hypothetical protein [Flavobacterium piscis]MDR7208341.1 hypothetical protein [Flavobacterium piscis]